MDEQRAWIKSRRRKRLRFTAVLLSICLLVTNYPDIWGTLSALAEESGRDDTLYVTGFEELEEGVREQTVPLGTEIEDLTLPDTLEAFITLEEEAVEEPAPEEEEPDDAETDTEEDGTDGETDDGTDENGGASTETDAETGTDENGGDGTGTDAETGTDENGDDSTGDNGSNDNNDSSGAGTDENGDDSTENNGDSTDETTDETQTEDTDNTEAQQEESAPEETQGESAPQARAESAVFSRETHTVTLPAYAAENELDIETLEQSEQTEQVTIENITWESDPSYDAETEGVYVFTPVLPEGYALSEGAVLPEIRVQVEMMGQTLTPEQYAHMIAGLQDAPALLTEEDVLAEAPELAPMTYGLSRAAGRAAAGNPGTYLTTEDNEDNAGSGNPDGDLDQYLHATSDNHPIEATIEIPKGKLPRNSCYIAVRTYDVNWRGLGDNEAEYDKLFVNGVRVGTLTGLDYDWNTSYYQVPLSCLKEGKNTVRVEVYNCQDKSTFGSANPKLGPSKKWNWGVSIDWMQLVCDGGSRAGVEEFSLRLKEDGTVTSTQALIGVETVIESTNTSATYHTEYSIMDSKGFIVGSLQEQDVKSGSHDITITMPLDSASGPYTVQGLLKNAQGAILATDSAQFQYIQGNGMVIGPLISHTLSPETLTRQNVTVTPRVADAMGCTNIKISPASKTAEANGKYDFTVTYNNTSGKSDSFTYTVQVANIDKEAPDITYNSAAVISAETADTAEEQLGQAWTITDNVSPRERCKVTYSLDCSKEADFKKLRQAAGSTISVTVTATDEAGNKKSDTRTVNVAPLPLELSKPTAVRSGTTSTFTLTAQVTAAADVVTESGFVWGTMQSPTLSFNQGSGRNVLNDVKTDGKIQVKAADVVDGVTYYCRAYAKAGGVTYYSEQASFGINPKSYGTFTVKNNNNSTFTITRTGSTDGAQTVYYRTVNGSAVGGTHFEHKAGTVVFGQGETTKTVTVTEKSVTASYGGKTSTGYSNADRTYSLEIYRVDGGGTLGSTTRATRTMAKNSNYTVRRSLYTGENQRSVAVNDNNKWVADNTDRWWRKVIFINDRGKNAGQGNKNFNVQRTIDVGNTRENAYLRATATGYSYRLELNATETDSGYEHIWISNHAPNNMRGPANDNHTDYESIPLDYSYFGHAYYTGRWEIGYHGTGTVTAGFPSESGLGKTENPYRYKDSSRISGNWVLFDLNDTAHVWFAANGNKKNMWYLNSYTDYVKIRDTREPQWIGTAPMAGGTYKAWDEVVVSLIFDEIVDNQNSTLGNVSINTSWGTFSYAGGADTNVLYFTGKVPANATGTLGVNSINGTGYIKDMCGDNGSTPGGSGSVTVSVDTKEPTVSITNTDIINGTAKGTVRGTNVSTLKYAWTQSETMPVTGWMACTNGAEVKTRQENGKWYLHVLGTYGGTGKNAWTYEEFDFGTPDNPKSPLPSLELSTDNSQWAKERPITITKVPTGDSLTVKTPSGETENIGTEASYKAQENGMYTFTMTVDGETLQESIVISRLDHTAPTVVLKDAGAAKDGNGNYILYHTLRMTATAADSESGIQDVKYCFTKSQSAPAATDRAWETATAPADGVYVFEKPGESTTAETWYLHVMAADNVGNTAAVQTSPAYMLVKGQDVKITLTEDQNWTNGETTTLTWKITDAGAGNCTVSQGEKSLATEQNANATGTFTVTENGVYTVSVRDKNGNTASVLCAASHIDREAPQFNVSAPSGNATQKTVTLSDVNDNLTDQYNEMGRTGLSGSGVDKQEYQAPGADAWTEFTGTTFTATKNGTYTVRLTDGAGNVSEKTLTLSGIDATKPTAGCEILSDKDASNSGWYTANPFQVKLTYADGTGGEGGSPSGIASVQYKWVHGNTDADKPTTGLTGLNAAAVAAGEYTLNLGYYDNAKAYFLYYKVTDKTGNVTEGFSEEIKKDSYKGVARVTGPSEGVSAQEGLAMKLESLSYGPSGGKVTGGQTGEGMSVTLQEHDSGQKTYGGENGDLSYTAKTTGNHYFRIYPGARNSASTTSSYYWAFYVRKVTFDCQGGPEVYSQLVWHDSTSNVKCKVAKPEKPERTGYTFGGWYTDAACTAKFDFNTQVRKDTTLYAKWTANTYEVSYQLTNPDGTTKTDFGESYSAYTYGKGLTLPAPEWTAQTGFAFDGWYTDANFTGPSYTAIGETATGDKTYYGRFKDVEAPTVKIEKIYAPEERVDGWRYSFVNSYITVSVKDNRNTKESELFIKWDDGEFTSIGKCPETSDSGKAISMDVYMNQRFVEDENDYYSPWYQGEHTLTFKVVDAAGNEGFIDPFAFKYDNGSPSGKSIPYNAADVVRVTDSDNKPVYYLCGKEKVDFSFQGTDSLSGIGVLEWREREKGDAGIGEYKTQQLSGEKEETVTFTFGPGTVKEMGSIIVRDKAGSGMYVVLPNLFGVGTISTATAWIGIIVEDTAPTITLTDEHGNPLSKDWYESGQLSQAVAIINDAGNDESVVSSGIKSYYIYLNGKLNCQAANITDLSYEKTPTINFPADATGVVNITVEVEDHAGNTARKSVDVKIKGNEQMPAATADYPNDALKGLAPGADYKITVGGTDYTKTADENGRIPFVLDGGEEGEGGASDICGKTVSIVKLGAVENGSKCSEDSEPLSLTIVARPAAINVSNITVTPEVMPETGNAVINLTIAGASGAKEYRWQSVDGSQKDAWKDVPDNNEVQNLKAGHVFVRVKATEIAPHGIKSSAKEITAASNTIKAVFDLNGDGATGKPEDKTADKGSTVLTEPAKPQRANYDFTGWYMEPDCQTKWRFEKEDGQAAHMVRDWRKSKDSAAFDPVTVDEQLTITLYAGWRENVKPTLTPKLATTDGTPVTDQENWYPELALSLGYSDNVAVTKLSVSVDGGAYQALTLNGTSGTDTNGHTIYTINNVVTIREGNHTYTFRAEDAAGNETEVTVTAKQDGTPPALGAATFTEGHRSFWDWIVGKETLTITIPVTETLSGIGNDGVEYVLTPDGGSAQTAQKAKVTGSTEEGYTAKIGIDPDFKGKIAITATDNAGNVSGTQTIGASGSGINGVIVEDNAPVITILADRGPGDASSTKTEAEAEQDTITNNTNIDLSNGAAYYNSAPRLYVKVKDTGTDENGKITSGLQSVTWKIDGVDGGAEHDAGLNFDSSIMTEHSFTISALEELSGIVTVTVKATDQAGNTTTLPVKINIKAREEKPAPVIDYINEKLTNLVPNGTYKLLDTDGTEKLITADEKGCIQIKEEWFGREIQLYKTGNGTTTLDSVKTDVKPAARPAPPKVAVTRNEKIQGKADGVIGRTDASLDLTTLEYSTDGGESWTAVTDAADVTKFKLSLDTAALENCAAGACLFRVRAVNDAPNDAPHGEQMEVIVGAGTPLTLSFEENGGSEIEDITGLSYHDSIEKPKDPKREGYALAGWYTDEAFSNEWHFRDEAPEGGAGQIPDRIEEDTTLYAKWEDTAVPALSAVLMNPNSNDTADEGQWYKNLSAALTYSDNEGVTALSVGVDLTEEAEKNDSSYTALSLSGAAEAGTGADGSVQWRIDYNDLTEGVHTYTFRAADAAGNVTLTRLTARLDTIPPVMGTVSYGTEPAGLWDWIIGKDSLIITVPLTEEGSGVETVDYVLTPDGDSAGISTGTAEIRELSDSDTGADYAAVITVPADFKGTVKVTARDFVGKSSAEKTLGVDAAGKGQNGIIVEDNAPDIQFAIKGGEVEERYYETAPTVDIAVDDTGWAGEPDGTGQTKAVSLTTGGIASVTCTITSGNSKNEYKPDTDYTTAMKTSDSFAIPAEKLFAGINTITVTAVDHAGNTAQKTVTVKVKTPEKTPGATIGYVAETLNGLVPNAEYRIEGLGMRADAKGSVPIDESWIGKTITVVQMGSTERTTESAPQSLTLPARPEAPDVTAESETYPGAGDGKLIMKETGKVYQYSSDGLTWKDAQTGADMKITGLAAKDYYVRAKAIENTSFRSKEGTVTVGTIPPTPYEEPNVVIDYENEKLTGLVPEAEYIVEYVELVKYYDEDEGKEKEEESVVTLIIEADKDGNIPVDEAWLGKEPLSVVQHGNGREKSDSEEAVLGEGTLPIRPGAPSPSGEDETGIRTGAKLTNLTSGKVYDISTDGGKTWSRKTADGSGVISGVDAPAEYIVRVAPVGGFSSPNSGKVRVDGYHIPVTFITDGVTTGTSWAYYGKAPQNIPAVPKKADAGDATYVGEWCVNVSGTPADLTNITAETTVYAYYTIGYNVTLQGGAGYTLAAAPGNASPVKEGADFTLQFTLGSGYEKTDSFAVKVNGVAVALKEEGTYTIENITEDQTVTVEGIVRRPSDEDSDDHRKEDNTLPTEDNPPAEGGTPAGGSTPAGGTKPGTETPEGTEPGAENPEGTRTDGKKPGGTKPGGTVADDQKPGETDADQTKPGGNYPKTEAPEGKTPGGSDLPDGIKLPDGTKLTGITVPVTIEDGKIILGDGAASIPTGSVPGMEAGGVILQMADGGGAVIVTVICEDKEYTAGVRDTIAVANAVLTPEQIELAGGGETIEILIDVKDITDSIPLKDKEIIEDGIEESRKDHPGLTLGMYIDISMFVKIGEGDWNTITHTDEPVDVVVGIPEELKADGREFTIIRSHDGVYTLLTDLDDNPDTITISTDLFSAYAIAYEETDQAAGDAKCGLCHICPTFLGICYFIWLALIIVLLLIIWLVMRRKKKEEERGRE